MLDAALPPVAPVPDDAGGVVVLLEEDPGVVVTVEDEDDEPPGTTTVSFSFVVLLLVLDEPLGAAPPGTTVVVSLRSQADSAKALIKTNTYPLRFMSTLLSSEVRCKLHGRFSNCCTGSPIAVSAGLPRHNRSSAVALTTISCCKNLSSRSAR